MKNLKLRMTGLCTSCSNWKNCTLLTDNSNPIQQCEEFELSRENTQPDISQLFVHKPENDTHYKSDQRVTLKGLCANCTLIETCFLTARETGVWHCEEFK